MLSRATNDLDKMAEVMQTGLLKLFTAVGMVAGSLIMMFYFHVGLTLVFLLFTVLAMLSTSFFSAKTLHCAAKRQQAVSLVTRRVEEAYSGRTVIKAFTQEKNSRKDMEEAVEELARTSRKADFMMNVVNPFIRMVNRLGQAVIAVFAGKLLLDGRAERGRVPGLFPVRVPGIGASDRGGIYDQFAAVFHSVRGADLSAAGRRGDPEGSITSGGSSECRRICGVLPCEIWVYERAYSDG